MSPELFNDPYGEEQLDTAQERFSEALDNLAMGTLAVNQEFVKQLSDFDVTSVRRLGRDELEALKQRLAEASSSCRGSQGSDPGLGQGGTQLAESGFGLQSGNQSSGQSQPGNGVPGRGGITPGTLNGSTSGSDGLAGSATLGVESPEVFAVPEVTAATWGDVGSKSPRPHLPATQATTTKTAIRNRVFTARVPR